MNRLPLISAWERQAVKTLTHVFYLLAHGEFESPADLATWLRREAEAIELLPSNGGEFEEISPPSIDTDPSLPM